MKKLLTKLLLCAGIIGVHTANAENYWQQINQERAPKNMQVLHPSAFTVYTLNEAELKLQLWNLSSNPDEGIVMTLPAPDGTYKDFIVWQASMMPDDLAAKYPDIKTFTAHAVNDQRVTAKIEYTLFGLTAMIYDGDNTFFIDPYDNAHDGFYMAHYKKDESRAFSDRMHCMLEADHNRIILAGEEAIQLAKSQGYKPALRTNNGTTMRTYRLALSADHQYCQAATGMSSPTIAQCFSKMTTSMNRINGVYNRELAVQMNFCSNEDTLIWPTASGSTNGADPFSSINSNGNSCLSANQTQCTNRIGSANYDVGHVFTTGGGGISSLGVVCRSTQKAQSCTGSPTPVGDGYDIDYVAHEMGHEFGSEHTFNNDSDGSCGGNAVNSCAYEPGSGATIMDYAGICPPDDLQPHSDAYFNASSLMQIQTKLAGTENTCAVTSSTANKPVHMDAFSASYTIPYKTPFELTAPTAVDSVADTLTTYCWAQADLGDFGHRLKYVHVNGPIFRSYSPVTTPTRVFPKVSMVLAGTLSNAGTENGEGEKVPDTARSLTFKMTVRDIYNGTGCFLFPDDAIHITATQTPTFAGFKVTSQGAAGISYTGGSVQTITWNVVGTDVAPVSADTVTIYMSRDGGNTWVDNLGNYPNNGTASVTLPNPPSNVTNARFKVKGLHNIFFNVNLKNFTVTNNPTLSVSQAATIVDNIKVFPVPATNVVHIATGNNSYHAVICNAVGQVIWMGEVSNKSDVDVSTWARGVYYARFSGTSGFLSVKAFTLQ